ncbi:MAG TPA: SMC family ATPase [Armatimonadota bacterium]|jgi:exonuclease SbcC
MKPTRLTLQAFGPFADEVVIDFDALGPELLFLIHGKTGSGKTTILDAMCLGLYGGTSGGDRTPEQLRSDYAHPDQATEVVLDFNHGNKEYRVRRSLECARPRKKGAGMTTQPPQAILWDRTDCNSNGDGHVIADRPTTVTERVAEILGFTLEQFRQVVVLPQGKFEAFLRASSKEREPILERLFSTDRCRVLQEGLRDRQKALESEIKSDIDELRGVLDEDTVDDYREWLVLRAATLVDQNQQLGIARAACALAQSHLAEGQRQAAALAEKSEADAALLEVTERSPLIEAYRATAGSARRAQPVVPVLDARNKAEGAVKTAQVAVAAAQVNLARAEAVAQDKVALVERENARAGERTDADKRVQYLEGLRKAAADVDEALRAVDAAQAALDVAMDVERTDTERVHAAQAAVNAADKALAGATAAAGELALAEARFRAAQQTYDQRQDLNAVETRLLVEEDELVDREATSSTADESAAAARNVADDWRRQWDEGAAGMLARNLTEGKPCPVCGSLKHPAPATLEESVPEQSAVTQAETDARALEAAARVAQGDVRDQRQAITATQKQRAALLKTLGAAAPKDTEELGVELALHRDAVTVAKEASDRLPSLQGELQCLTAVHAGASTALAEAGKQREAAQLDLSGRNAVLEARRGALPTEFADASALENSIVAAHESAELLRTALQSAQSDAHSAHIEVVRAGAALKATTEGMAERTAEAAAAQQHLEALMQGSDFADEESLDLAAASVPSLSHLEMEIRQFDSDYFAAEDRAQRAATATASTEAPNLALLLTRKEETERFHDDLVGSIATQEQEIENLHSCIARAEEIETRVVARRARCEVIGHIAEVANGTVSFQRWVLARYLDQVLDFASHRLHAMSSGRYRLLRGLNNSDRRRSAGLEILAEDAHTGKDRPVNTLSGGETFQAALSLALALSDVVCAESVGARLDTIFVDEGFGHLDPEALDETIATLEGLQAGGRLVGIISHVEELRQRIDTRLVVQDDGTGRSTAHFEHSTSAA